MKYLLLFSAAGLLFLQACTKEKFPKGTPDCIRDFVTNGTDRGDIASIVRYDYRGQEVYFVQPVADFASAELFDADCNLVCNPDASSTGTGCDDFFTARRGEEFIWVRE